MKHNRSFMDRVPGANLLLMSLLVASVVFAQSSEDTQLPKRSEFKHCNQTPAIQELNSGEIIELPLCFEDIDYFSLIASMDLEMAKELVKDAGLYPIEFNGKAMLNIAALGYGKSTIGSYNEFLVTMMVSKKPGQKRGWSKFLEYAGFKAPKDHGIHVVKLWVDKELPLQVGNELWGFNKDMAEMDFKIQPRLNSKSEVLIKNEFGQPMVEIKTSQAFPLWIPFGQNMAFNVNPADSNVWLKSEFRGNIWVARFSEDDSIQFFEELTFWGRRMASWNIEPLLLFQGSGIRNRFGDYR